MEGPQREGSPALPIATTPPLAGQKEELLSQSSSGTQISNASGVSLGEVIRRRSATNWEMEEWYQPCTEVDASNLIVAIGWKMSQTPGACDLTEFTTMEEGFVTPAETFGRQQAPNVTHSPILEIQDSCLSPKLPLLTTYATQGQTFFNETVFQPAEVDFAALRGTPDVSRTASEEASSHLQMREAVRLATMEVGSESSSDCLPLSQHSLAISTMAPSNTSLGSYLSQHPLSLSACMLTEQRNCNEEETPQLSMCGKTFGSKDGISGVLSSQNLPNQQMATPLESWGAFSGQDLFLLDSNVPAPLLLEILEEEVGLSKQYGFLSSESSSGKSVLGKDAEENETSQQMEDVVLVERHPETFVEPHQQEVGNISELDPLKVFSDSERKLGNASDAANTSQALASFGGQRVSLGDSCSNTGVPSRPLQNKVQVQHVSEVVFEEQKRKLVSAVTDCRRNVPLQPATMAAEHGNTGSKQVNSVVETQMGASKNELTLSDFIIEREHKDSGISPSFNEGSFFGHLAHPVHHSTPGLFTTRNLRQEASGMTIPAKSVLQSPLSCLREETSKNSSGEACIPSVEEPRVPSGDDTGVPSAEEPLTFQSDQEAKNESSGHLRVLRPLKGRIQSLPSLNFMEKVGAWNTSQSAERMPNALALDGSSGISPKQKSYSVIADSLNSILLKHQNQFDLKPGLVTPFCGPKSMTNLRSYDKKSPHALPLTRSQSENSVMAISREMSKTEVGHEKIQDYNLQPAEDKGHASGDSEVKQSEACRDDAKEPLIQHHTAVLVSTVSSDEERIEHVGSGKSSNPDNFITSERVAELLREETGSLSGCQEKSGGSPDNTRELSGTHRCNNQISMDCFRDVSPDSLNQLTSSGGGSCIDLRLSSGQSSRRSSAVSGKLQSSFKDVLQTSDHREMNIEERIPVYLHNLGIDQSPSSILTPFVPRGPIREIELSPTELRTLKASTDLSTQCGQLSEGDPHSVIDAIQSSFNSSIFSGPVPAGSHTGSDSPLPTELPSQPSGDLLGQSRTVCRQLQLCAPPQPLSGDTSKSPAALPSAELSQVIPEVPSDSHSEEERAPECVKSLADINDPKELGVSKEKPFCGSVAQENAEKGMTGETTSLCVDSEGERDYSFIGSETLKEIEKLLAESESRTSGRNFNTSSFVSSSTELGSSLKQMKDMDASVGSGPVKGSYPGIQRMWSWDETLNGQNVQEDNTRAKTLSLSGRLKWEGFRAVDIGSQKQVVPEKLKPTCEAVAEENKGVKPITRSEPEGCNSVVVNKSLPVSGNSAAKSNLSNPRDLKEFQATSSVKPSNTLENVQQVLEKTKGGSNKEMSSSHSSSVDSLGMKVKTLLRYEPPVLHSTRWLDEQACGESAQKQGSVGASLAGSKGAPSASQSNHSSSLDSLAARVKTLLEDERPVMHAIQILQSAEEEEAKAHASLKLKQAAQPADSVPDLNEEDRRMIEQIKREQYLNARTSGIRKGQLWRTGKISSPDPISKLNPELSKPSSGNELQKAIHTQNFEPVEVPKVVQARPVCRTDCALQSEPETKSINRIQFPACNQLQTHTDNFLDSKQNVHVPLGSAKDINLMELAGASRALVGDKVKASTQLTVSNSSTEPAKQITSITFASRKRLYSPASCPGFHKATPGNLVPLERQPFNNEPLKPSKPQQENLKPCALGDTAAVRILDRSVGFSSGRGSDQDMSLFGVKEETHLEKNIALVEKSQAGCIEQKVNFTEDYKEAQPSQILTELRRSDTLLDDVCDNNSNPKGNMADLSFSINVSQQKTDDACPQDKSADCNGSFPHTPEPKGKEIMLVKESSKLTFDSHLGRAGDIDVRSSSLLPPSPDNKATVLAGSPSSPTRKALSGVHITLSPKCIDLDLPGQLDTGTEMRQVGEVKNASALNASAISSEATSQLKPSEPSPKTQEFSYFPTPLASESQFKHPDVPVVAEQAPHRRQELLESRQNFPVQSSGRNLGTGGQSLEESSKNTAASQTERMSSDAITQITTESPEKTIYSAEIFVSTDNNETDAPRPLPQKRHEILSTTTADVNQSSIFSRQADPPLLLPYKPPGSSEVYYVPCSKETLGLSRMRSETTVESSHSGSNDAIPPKFPAQVLGSRDENPPDTGAIKHGEGIYSKRTVVKGAWTQEKVSSWEGFKESADIKKALESVKTIHSVFKPGEFYLHHPVPLQHEIDFLPRSDSLRQCSVQERPAPSSKDFFQHKEMTERRQVPSSLPHRKKEERFSPLTAELDYSFVEGSRFSKPSETDSPRRESGQPDRRKTGHETAKEPLSPGTQRTGLKEKQVADHPVMQSTYFTGSLDELWTKYLERQKQPLQRIADSSGRNELSLVERLDRLARLLQNPVRHSLVVPSKDEQSSVQEEMKRKEPKKTKSQGRVAYRSNLASHSKVKESPEIVGSAQLSKSRFHNIGATTAVDLRDKEKCQDFESLSDASSEMRPVKDSSVLSGNTSESGVTQLETESASRTEASGSVSTIDTARLIRAFGQDRVHISPKLSQLYSNISLQKTRSEKWTKGSRKSRTTDHPNMARAVPAGKNTQATDSFISSDSVSTAGGSRGPSSALSSKRSTRMLNKAVQAGDFEIVNSATKKHTRDVGQTFPTPTSSHARIQRDHGGGMEEELSQTDGGSSESKGKQRRQPSSFLAEKGPRKSKSQYLQGVSWFVPTEDLKSDPKRGNGSSNVPEPGPSWFEPLPSGKPWREPLREKNWQEDHSGLQVRLAAPARDIENNPPSPFGKITLQEALALRRPDFISSAGERVKRLKLIIEERRLQSMLQGEREELFNPPEQRRSYRNSAFLPNRDYRTIRRKRAISKNEMVQRSKRMYEQLPEVRKRREEEKRKSEYSTNRLKAQLYKTAL
ncbi:Alstrom syndrome protein 1 isoform X2 [Sceloporus undulatus]|uniref:Alstrom syndrome protein 1 isoform X2 n=1 Tax=Sceloporus undulatus TaxID=8520 RepID=UPI001C4BA21F|nr:Alstrom syndrome protein 1 isoform X2 [Sceloporus undulatus]